MLGVLLLTNPGDSSTALESVLESKHSNEVGQTIASSSMGWFVLSMPVSNTPDASPAVNVVAIGGYAHVATQGKKQHVEAA